MIIKANTHIKGFLYISLSAIFYGSYGVWSKLMTGTFGEFNQAWIRAIFLLAILIPFGIKNRSFKKVKMTHWKWFILISVIGGLNQAPYFWGFEHLPVGTATLLFYLSLTLGAYIIGFFFFKEKLTGVKITSLILGILGLSFLYTFSLSSAQTLPAISTMIAGLMGAVFVTFSKKLSSEYSETQILTAAVFCVLIGNGILSLLFKEITPAFHFSIPWFAQLGYTVSYLIANIVVIMGFRYLEPSIGGIIGLLEVFFGAIFGVLIFHEVITTELIVGSLLIVTAAGLSDISSSIRKFIS